jgi:hypothetical protein
MLLRFLKPLLDPVLMILQNALVQNLAFRLQLTHPPEKRNYHHIEERQVGLDMLQLRLNSLLK